VLGRPGTARAQKNVLKPWLKQQWKIPHVSAAFVAAMEDVLAVYAEIYDPQRPKGNCDETNRQLLADVQPPLPACPGQPQREDAEDKRGGPRHLFIHVEPQAGWRHGVVTARRPKQDFAQQMQGLVDERYPAATRIRMVLEQLNTHGPADARRLVEKREFHHTPKHGRWLNMAEIELSILQRQCLDRRLPDAAPLIREGAAWEAQRNQERATIDWRFSLTDAREKLKRLSPSPSVR
jgi:hypothetical protein